MVRGPVSFVLVAVVMLVMFMFVSMGPSAFERVLPERATRWLEAVMTSDMNGMGAGGGRRGDPSNPMSYVRYPEDDGRVTGPIVALEGRNAAMPETVFSGRETRLEKQVPGAVERLEPISGCKPDRPSAGAGFRHLALLGQSGAEIGLSTYGDSQLARGVQALVDEARGRKAPPLSNFGWYPYRSFDLAVTEVGRPLYIVVELPDQPQIINFHLAEGVQIERVVLIGNQPGGVANLPAGVPVEILGAAGLAACGFVPAYISAYEQAQAEEAVKDGPAQPEGGRKPAKLPGELGEVIAKNEESRKASDAKKDKGLAARKWRSDFLEIFGEDPARTLMVRWSDLTAALIGPLPAPDSVLKWQPIAGAGLRLSTDTYLETPAEAKGEAGYGKRVEAIATAFAGGDLAAIGGATQ